MPIQTVSSQHSAEVVEAVNDGAFQLYVAGSCSWLNCMFIQIQSLTATWIQILIQLGDRQFSPRRVAWLQLLVRKAMHRLPSYTECGITKQTYGSSAEQLAENMTIPCNATYNQCLTPQSIHVTVSDLEQSPTYILVIRNSFPELISVLSNNGFAAVYRLALSLLFSPLHTSTHLPKLLRK